MNASRSLVYWPTPIGHDLPDPPAALVPGSCDALIANSVALACLAACQIVGGTLMAAALARCSYSPQLKKLVIGPRHMSSCLQV